MLLRTEHPLKDVRPVLETAEHAATPKPFAGVMQDNLLDAIAHGSADHDGAALAEVSATGGTLIVRASRH